MWEMEGDWGKGMGNEGKGEETGCEQTGDRRNNIGKLGVNYLGEASRGFYALEKNKNEQKE